MIPLLQLYSTGPEEIRCPNNNCSIHCANYRYAASQYKLATMHCYDLILEGGAVAGSDFEPISNRTILFDAGSVNPRRQL